MSSFYPCPRPLPLTPPETELYHRGGCAQQQYSRQGKIYDEQFAYAPPAAPVMYQPPPMLYANMPPAPPPGLPIPSTFGSSLAPILPPPINVREHAVEKQNSSRRERPEDQRKNQPAKTEKAVGGVCAELDYEMDQMTDYVSEMAQSMYGLYRSPHICMADIDLFASVIRGSPVSPAFRKFVSGLLSSTRLPSSTILAGLNYLAGRMSMLNTPHPYKATDGQVWRMLTVALLLGSKFLDDNTFQNRSWSEVSGIPVKELNEMEKEWLEAVGWKLHVNLEKSDDFLRWLASWDNWRLAKNEERSATLERLAPLAVAVPPTTIDTNVQRHRSQRKNFSPAVQIPAWGPGLQQERRQSYPVQQSYNNNSWAQHVSPTQMSPPSAPVSGPNTPDYRFLGAVDWFPVSRYPRRQPAVGSQMQYHLPSGPYQLPLNKFSQNSTWSSHNTGCMCGYCRYNDPYGMAPGYSQQPVVG